jgi:hypothetical protein
MKTTKRQDRRALEPRPGKTHPTDERIRQRAFEIHKARSGDPGGELDDWLQAERELLAEQEHPTVPGENIRAVPFVQD